jgi:hypothetical protein
VRDRACCGCKRLCGVCTCRVLDRARRLGAFESDSEDAVESSSSEDEDDDDDEEEEEARGEAKVAAEEGAGKRALGAAEGAALSSGEAGPLAVSGGVGGKEAARGAVAAAAETRVCKRARAATGGAAAPATLQVRY